MTDSSRSANPTDFPVLYHPLADASLTAPEVKRSATAAPVKSLGIIGDVGTANGQVRLFKGDDGYVGVQTPDPDRSGQLKSYPLLSHKGTPYGYTDHRQVEAARQRARSMIDGGAWKTPFPAPDSVSKPHATQDNPFDALARIRVGNTNVGNLVRQGGQLLGKLPTPLGLSVHEAGMVAKGLGRDLNAVAGTNVVPGVPVKTLNDVRLRVDKAIAGRDNFSGVAQLAFYGGADRKANAERAWLNRQLPAWGKTIELGQDGKPHVVADLKLNNWKNLLTSEEAKKLHQTLSKEASRKPHLSDEWIAQAQWTVSKDRATTLNDEPAFGKADPDRNVSIYVKDGSLGSPENILFEAKQAGLPVSDERIFAPNKGDPSAVRGAGMKLAMLGAESGYQLPLPKNASKDFTEGYDQGALLRASNTVRLIATAAVGLNPSRYEVPSFQPEVAEVRDNGAASMRQTLDAASRPSLATTKGGNPATTIPTLDGDRLFASAGGSRSGAKSSANTAPPAAALIGQGGGLDIGLQKPKDAELQRLRALNPKVDPANIRVLYSVRHGETNRNSNNEISGSLPDGPFTAELLPESIQQARDLQPRMREILPSVPPGNVVSSDVKRARDTARFATEGMVDPSKITPIYGLREREVGGLVGISKDPKTPVHVELGKLPDDYTPPRFPPVYGATMDRGSESINTAKARVINSMFKDLVPRLENGNVVAFSHQYTKAFMDDYIYGRFGGNDMKLTGKLMPNAQVQTWPVELVRNDKNEVVDLKPLWGGYGDIPTHGTHPH